MLRQYGPKIIEWFKNLFKKAEETLSLLWKFRALINEIDIKVFEATSKAVVELDEINKRIADATKGTEEWRNMVLRVNEITGSTLDILTATPAEIQKVTKAYIAQAEQLAKNQFVIQKISESADNAFKKERAYKSKSVNEMASALGIATDSKDYEKLEDLYNSYIKKQEEYQEKYRKRLATYRDKHRLYQAKEDLKAFVEEIAPTRSQAELEALWDKYYKATPIKNTTNGRGKGVHEQDMADQYWEAEEALIKMRKVGYQQEIALAGMYHDKSVQEQINTNERMQQAVKENVENGFITKEEGARRLQELERQNDAILLDIDEKYQKEINSINTKYAEMDRQVVIEEEKNKIEELDELYKVQENNRKRRIRTIKEEELSNLRIVESIQKMQDEIAALNALN
ncbi:MAG: hypothetical protein II245_02350, partial [Bacteroidaceae bacterium]|nr:hypothetical protein [Bacteroidaceae bacterium]